MNSKRSVVTGFILIAIGLAILLRPYYDLNIYLLRSYGLVILGLFGLWRAVNRSPRGGLYLFSFLMLIGLYYLFAEWQFYRIHRGLTLSAFTIAAGLAFYPLYLWGSRKWNYLLFGNLILLVGLLFLGYYLEMIPTDLFFAMLEDYWPAGLIVIGIAYLIRTLFPRDRQPLSPDSQ